MEGIKVHPLSNGVGIAFLLETPHGLYLVDSGVPGQEGRVLAKMKTLGRSDLKLIWVTHAHYDHYGSAAALREATGAVIGVHPADAEFMIAGLSPLGTTRSYGFIYPPGLRFGMRFQPLSPTMPDFTLEDGETLERYGLEARVIHTPGHTPGHTCLLLAGGTAFAGDLIGGFPRLAVQNLLATNWESLPASLEKFKAAKPDPVYLGHRVRPISGSALQRIKSS